MDRIAGLTPPDISPALRRIVGNAALLPGGQAVNDACVLAYTAIAVRVLGLQQFGVPILIQAFALAVGEIARCQAWRAVLCYEMARSAKAAAVVQQVLGVSLLLDGLSALGGAALGAGLALACGTWFGWPGGMTPIAALYAACIAFLVPTTPSGLLRLVNRFDLLATRIGLADMFRVAAVVLLW